jgi:hypothetical protein
MCDGLIRTDSSETNQNVGKYLETDIAIGPNKATDITIKIYWL